MNYSESQSASEYGDSQSNYSRSKASSKGDGKTKKDKKKDKKDANPESALYEKKLKVLKSAMQNMKIQEAESIKQIQKLVDRNMQLENELGDGENRYLEIYEEYNALNDDMHELQQELEDAGFFDQGGEETEEKGNGSRMQGMFSKTRKVFGSGKVFTWGNKNKDNGDASNQQASTNPSEVISMPPTPSEIDKSDEKLSEGPKKDIKELLKDVQQKKEQTTDEKKKEKKSARKNTDEKENSKQIDELNNKLKEFQKIFDKHDKKSAEQEKEIGHYKELTNELAGKIQECELRETEYDSILSAKNFEIKEKDQQINRVEEIKQKRELEIDEFSKQLMKIKDEKLDQEAKSEQNQGQEKVLQEEIVGLQTRIQGKDQAIQALSQNLMEKARDHEKMSEMLNNFKNQILAENCFNTKFAAFKVKSAIFGQGEEVVIGFIRDRTFEEEFFLVIESKAINQKTGAKNKKMIPVEDLDEIEHTQGTQFEIHYYEKIVDHTQQKGSKLQGFLAKIKEKQEQFTNQNQDEKQGKREKSDIFESKFVKNIIETFQNVLGLIQQQEKELKMFITERDEYSDSDDDNISNTPKVYSAKAAAASAAAASSVAAVKPKSKGEDLKKVGNQNQKIKENIIQAKIQEDEYYDEEGEY